MQLRPVTETDPYWGDTVVVGSYLELTEFVDGAWTTPVTLTSISPSSTYACYHRFPRLSADGKGLIYQDCEPKSGVMTYGLYELVTSLAPPALVFPIITGTLATTTSTTFWASPVTYAFAPDVFSDTVILSHTIPSPATIPPRANSVKQATPVTLRQFGAQ